MSALELERDHHGLRIVAPIHRDRIAAWALFGLLAVGVGLRGNMAALVVLAAVAAVYRDRRRYVLSVGTDRIRVERTARGARQVEEAPMVGLSVVRDDDLPGLRLTTADGRRFVLDWAGATDDLRRVEEELTLAVARATPEPPPTEPPDALRALRGRGIP